MNVIKTQHNIASSQKRQLKLFSFVTDPCPGWVTMARGFSRSSQMRTLRIDPSRLATSMRDVPESDQNNLSCVQSTAIPPAAKCFFKHEQIVLCFSVQLEKEKGPVTQFVTNKTKLQICIWAYTCDFFPGTNWPEEKKKAKRNGPGLSRPVLTISCTLLPLR